MSPVKTVLRIAFDIGSGATKVCGALLKVPVASASSTLSSPPPVLAPVIDAILYEKEEVLLIGQAVKHESADGKTIPDKTIAEVICRMKQMLGEVHNQLQNSGKAVDEEERVGIATAIFRSATNGDAVLTTLLRDPTIATRIYLLPQDDEAALGFETAKQYLATNHSVAKAIKDAYFDRDGASANACQGKSSPRVQLVSYDSGAASFQLCTASNGCHHLSGESLTYFNGQWGSTISHLALVKVVKEYSEQRIADFTPSDCNHGLAAYLKKRLSSASASSPAASASVSASSSSISLTPEFELDPNPIGPTVAKAFHQLILNDLNNDAKHPREEREYFRKVFGGRSMEDGVAVQLTPDAPLPFLGGEEANAAGVNSRIVILQAFGGYTSAFNMCSKVFNGASFIHREALWDKITTEYCYKTNAELKAMDFVQPEVLLAKLILVYSVMKHLGIEGIHFQIAIGNTRALMGMEKYWNRDVKYVGASTASSSVSKI